MVSRAVFIDGLRTPFQLPLTGYWNMTGNSLLSATFSRLLSRIKIDKKDINHVIAGNVLHEAQSPNIAGSSAHRAGISAPSHTITMACISGQAALGQSVAMINSGYADFVLVGGVEYLSDLPIRVNRKMRKLLIKARNTKSMSEKLNLLTQVRLQYAVPDVLRVVEFQTGKTFLYNGDKVAKRFGISREQQDEYGYRSHVLSGKAHKENKFNFICSVDNSGTGKTIITDSTLQSYSLENMSGLRTVRKGGTVTKATANQPCDGAAACLIASETAAEKFNLTPLAELSSVSFAGVSPRDNLLLGTTHALAKLKTSSGLNLESADVVELYEGFAGEILSQLSALRCPQYARTELNLDELVADLDIDRINKWGGTIGLGHPFGATGIRLLMHAVGRLHDEGGDLGLVAGCAGGGLGAAFSVKKL